MMNILILRIFNHSPEYDAMYDIHMKFNNGSIFVLYNPDLSSDYNYNDKTKLLEIKGTESFMPGLLDKTIRAMEICLKLFKFDYLIRSNISTVIDIEKFNKEILAYNSDFKYGGKVLELYWLHPEAGIIDHTHDGLLFAEGCDIVLSRESVVSLVSEKYKLNTNVVDDLSIGIFFKEKNIKPIFLSYYHAKYDIDKDKIGNVIFIRNKSHVHERERDIFNIDLEYNCIYKHYNKLE